MDSLQKVSFKTKIIYDGWDYEAHEFFENVKDNLFSCGDHLIEPEHSTCYLISKCGHLVTNGTAHINRNATI